MIKVIIDARMVDEKLHGISRYVYELVRHLGAYEDLKIHLLINNETESRKIFSKIENLEYIPVKAKFLSFKEQIELPRVLNKLGESYIFHSPSFTSSPFIKIKTIMTIHDLNHIRFPEFYTPFHKYFYEYIVKPSALKCSKLLTVSEFSKEELIRWLKCERDAVEVTYNGIDEEFKKETDVDVIQRTKNKYDLPDNFILYIGNQKPHKNVETLVRAMSEIKDEITLVINGKNNESVGRIISDFGIDKKVKFIGFVDDKDLSVLYSMAKVFVFPSLYEGFGLPPLEAMSCECPVIVSDTSSLPEVVGDAAIKVDSMDYRKMAEAISALINDKEKCSELSLLGLERAKNFNWKETAEKTYQIYKEVYGC